jgi:hypothetical protein
MRIESLTENARAYRNDLRGEMNAIYNRNRVVYQGRESEGPIVRPGDDIFISLPGEAQRRLNSFGCRMPRHVFDDAVDQEKRFGRRSSIVADDREISGVGPLCDNSWPFCRDCLLPFTTLLNGHAGHGYWVSRIEDDSELCECCWLAEHYASDRAQMIEHVLRSDTGDDARLIRVERRRGSDLDIITTHLERGSWHSPGLRELIRLHRVSLTECAEVIVRMVRDLVKKVRCEVHERNSGVSNRLTSGTRAPCYA